MPMRQNRKTEILNASAALFRSRGYNATSLKDIASAVGIEAPSLYNHIKSKNEILVSLLEGVADNFIISIHSIEGSSLTGIQKLEKIISHYVALSFDKPDAMSLITSEWVHLNETDKEIYVSKRIEYEQVFRKIFRQAAQEGSIKPVNEDIAIYSIISSLRWLYSWVGKHQNFNAIELEKQMIISLIDGLRA